MFKVVQVQRKKSDSMNIKYGCRKCSNPSSERAPFHPSIRSSVHPFDTMSRRHMHCRNHNHHGDDVDWPGVCYFKLSVICTLYAVLVEYSISFTLHGKQLVLYTVFCTPKTSNKVVILHGRQKRGPCSPPTTTFPHYTIPQLLIDTKTENRPK